MVWANLFKIAKPGPSKFAHEFWGESTRAGANWGSWGSWELCGVRRGRAGRAENDHFQVEIDRVEVVSGGLAATADGPEVCSGSLLCGLKGVPEPLSRADRRGFAKGVKELPHVMINRP